MRHLRRGRLSWTFVAVFVLLGPLMGVMVGRRATRLERERASALCSEYVSQRAEWLARETYAISGELSHLRSLFEASEGLARAEFKLFTAEVLADHPAIQAIEWVPRVLASQREAHEQRARAEGFQDYRIRMKTLQGGLPAAPSKEEYYPVFYAEPLEPNRPALGFDLSTEKVRNAALTLAIQTRRLSLSDPIDLVQGAGDSKGLLALLPVYRRGGAADGAGRDQLEGLVLLVIRTTELLQEALPPHQAARSLLMHFELVDEDAGGTPQVIGTSTGGEHEVALTSWTCQESLDVGNQRWRLIGRPTEEFMAGQLTRWPLIVGVGVFLCWEVLGGLALSLLIWQRDASLRRQTRVYEAAFRDLVEGVVVADPNGKFLLFNPAAERILGIGPRDVSVPEWSATYGCFYPDAQTPFPPERLPLARALRGETAREDVFIRNSGVPNGVWISISGAPLRDERGAVEGGAVVFHDVSTQRKTSEELQRLSNAVEQTADAVFITNRDGVIEYVNPAFEATTGYTRQEALGQTPRILKSGKTDPHYYAELWRTILAGETFRAQIVNRRKNGDLYHAEQTVTPVRDPDGHVTHFVSVVKDVTDRIRRQVQEMEMHYASLIQQKLYPAEAPRVEGYDIAGAAFPAEATCGDYFDYVPLPDDGLGLVIGDACGHGLGPALIMTATRSYLRSLSTSCSDLARIFETMNDALYADLERNRFVAMALLGIDVRSGRAAYVNAGHTPGYHLDQAGAVKAVLGSTGLPLGAFPNETYECIEDLALEPGDLVVLVTDGIPEAEDSDGNYFGMENALNVIRAHRHETAEQIVQHLHQATRKFVGEASQQDDITVVVCKAAPLA